MKAVLTSETEGVWMGFAKRDTIGVEMAVVYLSKASSTPCRSVRGLDPLHGAIGLMVNVKHFCWGFLPRQTGKVGLGTCLLLGCLSKDRVMGQNPPVNMLAFFKTTATTVFLYLKEGTRRQC